MSTPLRTRQLVGIYLVLCVVAGLYLFPVYWTLVTSIKPLQEILGAPTLFPRAFSGRHYRSVVFGSLYLRWVLNSFVIAGVTGLLTTMMALGTGYSISRLRFPGRRLIAQGVLVVYLFPGILLVVPLFQVMHLINLHDTMWSVTITHVLLGLPFGTWTVRSFMGTIPTELEDAARMDGATRLRTLRSIYVPLLGPGLATVAIFSVVVSWNDYLFPVILLSSRQRQVISVGIASWTAGYNVQWGEVAAAAMLAILPVVVFYAIAGRYFVQGLTAGAVKS